MTYYIAISDAAPSMNRQVKAIDAGTYEEAVAYLRKIWKDTGRAVSLHSDEYAVYAWQYIGRSGEGWDRNNGGGFEGDFSIS